MLRHVILVLVLVLLASFGCQKTVDVQADIEAQKILVQKWEQEYAE